MGCIHLRRRTGYVIQEADCSAFHVAQNVALVQDWKTGMNHEWAGGNRTTFSGWFGPKDLRIVTRANCPAGNVARRRGARAGCRSAFAADG